MGEGRSGKIFRLSGRNRTYGMAYAETAASFMPFLQRKTDTSIRRELRRSLVEIPRNSVHDFVEFDNNNNFQHSFNFSSITQQHTDSSSQNPGCGRSARLLLHGHPSI